MARNHTGDVVVQPRSSRTTRWLLGAAAAACVVALGIALYFHGLAMAGYDRNAALAHERRLKHALVVLRQENRGLRQSLAVAERSVQMDEVAYRDLHASLQRSADTITRLQERVDLYKAILAPASPLQGVTIERLQLSPLLNRRYRYTLILVQPLEARGPVAGRLRFRIAGTGGPTNEVVFPPKVDTALGVHFKYFQDVEGTLSLPPGFTPTAVEVDVRTQGRLIQKTFPWPAAG
ncbi:MAG TPA: DUF6776 family protein [Acidiferrobacteraceae bacterium]|nr:DUF6776 family protein [Acidiferrobacteraceae bacterium]